MWLQGLRATLREVSKACLTYYFSLEDGHVAGRILDGSDGAYSSKESSNPFIFSQTQILARVRKSE